MGALVVTVGGVWVVIVMAARGKFPRPRTLAVLAVVALVIVLLTAFAQPIAQGYHFGCHWYDSLRVTRLGVELCK